MGYTDPRLESCAEPDFYPAQSTDAQAMTKFRLHKIRETGARGDGIRDVLLNGRILAFQALKDVINDFLPIQKWKLFV